MAQAHPSRASASPCALRSTIVLALLVGLGAHAQVDCRTEKDEVDLFTKQHTVAVSPTHSSKGPVFSWHGVNNNLCFRLGWQFPAGTTGLLLEGDTLLLMLENDSVLALPAVTSTLPVPGFDIKGVPVRNGTYDFRITPQQARMLDQHWVKRLRVYFHDGYQDYNAEQDPIWQMGVAKTAYCFISACQAPPPVPALTKTAEMRGR